jgi:hypothetical protein
MVIDGNTTGIATGNARKRGGPGEVLRAIVLIELVLGYTIC